MRTRAAVPGATGVRRGLLPVDRLLTGRPGLDELDDGFDRLRTGGAIRQVVEL